MLIPNDWDDYDNFTGVRYSFRYPADLEVTECEDGELVVADRRY